MAADSWVAEDDRVDVAIHEIGHGLLCALFDMPMNQIKIWKSFIGGYAGHVKTDWKSMGSDEDVELLAITYAAGQEAQSLWLERTRGYTLSEARAHTQHGARSDLKVIRILQQFIDLPMPLLRSRTDKILLSRWDQIVRLGMTLAERKRIATGTVQSQAGSQVGDSGLHIRKFETLDQPFVPANA